jgi:hypothetical protein
MTSYVIRIAAVAFIALGALPNSASAQRGFDGQWSVLIVTESGTCDRAYRYGVTIRSGNVLYNGGAVSLSGRVAANGSVQVRVSSGSAFANGTGRLNRNAGSGNWSGQSSGGRCSGYWTAERRS